MKHYIKTTDYFFSQEEFELKFDTVNEMLITSPIPDNLTLYYKSENYISHSDQSKTIIDKLYLLVKNYSLRRKVQLLNSLIPSGGTLLDIGAGTGDFLKRAKKANWTITGIEPNKLARENAKTKGIQLHEDLSELTEPNYDIITLWHVLEHLPNLNEQLTQITNLLKKDGFLILAVPNYKSYDAKHYKRYWAAYDVPRHLWHFSQKSIVKLLTPHSMELSKTKPMLFDSFYVSLLSEKYKTGKNRYLSAFFHGLLSNLKGMISKEYSSHIYILQKS